MIGSGFGRGTTYRLNREYVASSDLASSDLASSNVASSDVASSDVASSDVASSMDENVISMIKACCAYKWLSAKEISEKIGRHPTHTRRIIKKMLAEGILKAEYPKQPTHPAQRYRIK